MGLFDSAEIARLEEEKAALERRVNDLGVELSIARVAGHVAAAATAQIEAYVDSGQLLEAAEGMALVTVTQEEKTRLAQEQRDALLAERREEFIAQFRHKQASVVRQELDTQFTTDGTYDRLRQEVDAEGRLAIAADLERQARADYAAELADPVAHGQAVAEARTAFLGSPGAEKLRKEVRKANETEWATEAEESAQKQIDTEEAAREAGFIAARRGTYLASNAATQHRTRTRAAHEKTWQQATDQEVAKELGDQELLDLLTEKASLARERLERENRSAALLAEFESRGLDVTALQAGDTLTVYLGELLKEFRDEVYFDTGAGRNMTKKVVVRAGVVHQRILKFEATGQDGAFVVRSDSLASSDSVFEQHAALDAGVVVKVGRGLVRSGNKELEQRVSDGMLMVYDTDPETPETFEELPVAVANIKVNGISARAVDYYRPYELR